MKKTGQTDKIVEIAIREIVIKDDRRSADAGASWNSRADYWLLVNQFISEGSAVAVLEKMGA